MHADFEENPHECLLRCLGVQASHTEFRSSMSTEADIVGSYQFEVRCGQLKVFLNNNCSDFRDAYNLPRLGFCGQWLPNVRKLCRIASWSGCLKLHEESFGADCETECLGWFKAFCFSFCMVSPQRVEP